MNRTKRFRRGSTADRASVDTTTSSASTSSTQQPSQKKVKVEDGTGREPSAALSDHQPASPSTADLVEELFTAVVQQLGTDFSLLPSRKEYPDYYEMTAKPIDLKQIAMKIQKNEYAGLEGLVEDLTLLANNAIDYNIPSSQIYKEAAMLKKFVANKKVEYEQRELHRTKERTVRTRRSTAQATQPVSAVFAALEYGEDDDSEGRDDAAVEDGAEEETMEADSEDEDGTSQDTGSIITRADGGGDDKTAAMLELFTSVVKLKGTTNKPMSGPFMKLPSKRMYPIYYTTIVSPIALSNIKSKIKNGLYLALDEMFVDLLLMCQNAQTFNDNNSIIYRNSERIKKFVEARQKEFQDEVQKKSSALRTALSERLWPEYDDSLQRKRAKYLVRSLLECRQGVKYFAEDFLEKPAKKEYPDYYDVITQPVDLKTLVKNVLGDKYLSEEALLVDLDLLCSNAKLYNEEGSDIFEAAVKLEETIKRAQKTLDAHLSLSGVAASGSSSPRRVAGPSSSRRALTKFPAPSSPLQAALIELYEHVTDVTDPEEVGRKLCEMFQTLPLKTEMPSYYEVIKKPVDLDRIQYRIIHDQYRTFSEAIEDFGQMFENAAAFNEPTSAIYRDALVLLYAVMEKSSAMPLAFTEIPNVQQKVQEIIRALMDSVINLVKPDGRNVSETIAECAWNDSDSESEASNSHGSARTYVASSALTLESIKANVYAGRYRRLDRFQDDMFELLEKARFTAQPDSQTYEDAVDLHIHFITTRDELCGNGAKLLTPALHYNVSQFNASIEQERKEAKLRPPSLEPSRVTPPPPSTSATVAAAVVPEAPSQILPPMDPNAKCVMIGVDAFYAGDFVYVEPYDKGKQPLIVCIEEFVEQNGDLSVRGSYMLRPEETFHLANRRFYEKEVFKSDMAESHLPGRIRGRCFVMSGKDYFKLRPVGLDAKDVYVCDTRYSTRTKSFQKIKIWKMPENQRIQLIPRETLLPAVRVPSVFASLSAKDGSMKPDSWSATTGPPGFPLCKDSEIIDVIREPVLAKSAVPEEGVLAYEQKDSPVGFIKIGDCFSVKGESADRIIKVEKIFDKGPETFVSGIIFVFTKDLPPTIALPAKLFYHNEVFQKVTEETLSVKQLATRCAVLSLRDFSSCRQTELTEDQVYIVESKILENGTAGRRTKGSRLLNVSAAGSSHATDDEIFFFEKPVDPRRVVSPFLEPVLSGKVVEIDRTPEESPVGTISYDDDALSISHASEISFATPLSPAASNYDGSGKKRSRSGKKLHKKGKYTVSGFILYGADNRRAIKDNHPGLSFQETSRHVSDMWRALTTGERKKWEDEAKRKSNFVNSEMKSRGYSHLDGISFKGLGSKNDMDLIVELERRAQQQEAHLKDEAAKAAAAREATQAAQTQAAAAAAAAHAASLPSTSGMSNHQTQQSQSQPPSSMTAPGSPIKTNEAGGQGQTGTVQMISPQALAMMQSQHQQYQRIIQQQQMQIQQQQQVQRPLFLTLPSEPPKVKRALHSEVFLKYLENNGMGSHPKPDVPYWRRQLAASQDTIPPPRQIPDYWPSLLNIDAETKNKGMEMVSRMWSTRNLIFTKTCGLVPVPLTQSTGGGPSSSNSTAGPSSKPFSPPIALPVMARERSSARRPPSSRR